MALLVASYLRYICFVIVGYCGCGCKGIYKDTLGGCVGLGGVRGFRIILDNIVFVVCCPSLLLFPSSCLLNVAVVADNIVDREVVHRVAASHASFVATATRCSAT